MTDKGEKTFFNVTKKN